MPHFVQGNEMIHAFHGTNNLASSVLMDIDPFQQPFMHSPNPHIPLSPKYQPLATTSTPILMKVIPTKTRTTPIISTKLVSTCNIYPCINKTFGRPTDLERHIASVHGCEMCALWCPAPSCNRNQTRGENSFKARKDKLLEHIKKVHFREKGRWHVWYKQIDDIVEENREAHERGEH
jgi:hypothetical protein